MKLSKLAVSLTVMAAILIGGAVNPSWAKKASKKQKQEESDDEGSSFQNEVSVNPLALIFGIFDVGYERKMDERDYLSGRVNYWGATLGDWNFSAFGASGAWYFYNNGNGPSGFYWGPGVSVQVVNATYAMTTYTFDYTTYSYVTTKSNVSASGFLFGPTVELGYQWVFDNGFALDLAGGGIFYLGGISASSAGTSASLNISGFRPALRFSLGYAFN